MLYACGFAIAHVASCHRYTSILIHHTELIDFLDEDLTVHSTLDIFRELTCEQVKDVVTGLDYFNRYILNYFYKAIATNTF